MLTKKQIEELKQCKWYGEGAYIFEGLIETVEELVGVLESYRCCDIACECLSQYEKED